MLRFGRKPADPVRLARAPVHRFGSAVPRPALDRSAVPFTPLLGGNDIYSNCTVVSVQNMIEAQSALQGYGSTYIDPQKALDFFAMLAGNPADLTTVDGLVYLDVLQAVATVGFDTGHDSLNGLPAMVDLTRNDMAIALEQLGGIGIGGSISNADMLAFETGAVFDVLPGQSRGPIAGLHAFMLWDYNSLEDDGLCRIATWGKKVECTWRWLEASTDEVHGVSWPQLMAALRDPD